MELLWAFREQREPFIHHNWGEQLTGTIRKQFTMGQKAFLSRLWDCGWIEGQNNYNKTLKTKTHGITIVVKMIKYFQKIVREIWYGQNDALHTNEQSRHNTSKSLEYNLLIDSIYQRKRSIPIRLLAQADIKYFWREMQSLKRMQNSSKERWVKGAEAILDKYDMENETDQVRAFRNYFIHRDDR